jgi:hypothetical protein
MTERLRAQPFLGVERPTVSERIPNGISSAPPLKYCGRGENGTARVFNRSPNLVGDPFSSAVGRK